MSNTPLHYITRPSTLKDNAPLLIMSHGYGSDEKDLFSFVSEFPKELFVISLRAPYSLYSNSYAWYAINFDAVNGKWSDDEQAKKSVNTLSNFIEYSKENYPINSKNITLLGFSQGAILSYAVALTYPKKVKNVIALSGYINEDIIPDDIDKNALSKLQVFCSHGRADQVIPLAWAQQSLEILKAFNIPHIYKEYPVGHGITPQNFYDFKNWLVNRI